MKHLKIYLLLFCALTSVLYTQQTKAQSPMEMSGADTEIYNKYIKWSEKYKTAPTSRLMLLTAKYFAESPYKTNTLEVSGVEKLTVNLREFDCTTLIETCVALTNTVKAGDTSTENFMNNLRKIRYRNGVIDGYTSRLHYMTDWVYEGEKNGIVKDMSLTMEGDTVKKDMNYMSNHPKKYTHLKDNIVNTKKMVIVEDQINKREIYNVIPTKNIPRIEWSIQDGDIILFATKQKGLDYTHAAIACKTIKGMKFVHASSDYKHVVEDGRTIYGYCFRSKTITGITVVRVK